MRGDASGVHLYTIGHSTRSLDQMVRLLEENHVSAVAGIRTVPRSRRNPQFNREVVAEALEASGVRHAHLEELGGLRRPRRDSPNAAWENASFRGFADYTLTEEFEEALQGLLGLARAETTAIMCAEAVPWRCHRSLIADALVLRNMKVQHIISRTSLQLHELTSFAVVEWERITYPPAGATRSRS